VLKIIIKELESVISKYGKDRKTKIIAASAEDEISEEELKDTSPVTLFFTKDGYFKKITPLSLRMSGEQKLKEGDEITQVIESNNATELLFFSNKCQVYKARTVDFADSKASIMGDYIPSKLSFDEAENAVYMAETTDYSGYMVFVFENGRVSKVPLSSYETKTQRKKLIKAYSEKYALHSIFHIKEDREILLKSSNGRMLIINTAQIPSKASKENGGIAVMTQKKGQRVTEVSLYEKGNMEGDHRYRARNLPAAGSKKPSGEDAEQTKLEI
jgi:DNA gyrase subunit A